jgi:hypothetical protein
MPSTTRINKLGETAEVKAIHIGQRVNNDVLLKWIDEHPIVNESVKQETRSPEDSYPNPKVAGQNQNQMRENRKTQFHARRRRVGGTPMSKIRAHLRKLVNGKTGASSQSGLLGGFWAHHALVGVF